MTFENLLLSGLALAGVAWAALGTYVLHVSRRRDAARANVSRLLGALEADDIRNLDVPGRVERLRPLLDLLSREMILHTTADADTPPAAFEVLVAYLPERWAPDDLVAAAAAHRRHRDIWRRAAALRILARDDHPRALDLMAAAADDGNQDLAAVALSLLGASVNPRAIDILITALKRRRHPASQIAIHLDASPQQPVDRYRELLQDSDSEVRLWGATLLGSFASVQWVEEALAPLTADGDPRVRKAAIESLGRVGAEVACDAALRLLSDAEPFVRGHAARALGQLERSDCAAPVAALLGDRNWWVRLAAKQSLEAMGPDVWPVLVRCLEDGDGFVRNGAAEVFQNIGVLDSLVLMEAASDDPSPAKVDLLRRIADAGGTRLTESLLERTGSTTAVRVRRLLDTLGLEHVGAA